LARSHADAPEIDAAVRVKGKGLRAGDIVRVHVTAADGYDLAARLVRDRDMVFRKTAASASRR
jgi:hypothetical protein